MIKRKWNMREKRIFVEIGARADYTHQGVS